MAPTLTTRPRPLVLAALLALTSADDCACSVEPVRAGATSAALIVGDAITGIARHHILLPILRYVDDYFCPEREAAAEHWLFYLVILSGRPFFFSRSVPAILSGWLSWLAWLAWLTKLTWLPWALGLVGSLSNF